VWDACGPQAHCANRAAGQPFSHCYSSLAATHMARIADYPPGCLHTVANLRHGQYLPS
jgi:hypothetical protein